MSETPATYKGEQLSFFQLLTVKEWKIEIPIIQRDYAQGRDSAQDIRERFLSSLYRHLDEQKNIDLDFIYGSIKQNKHNTLIPLDGQQRLTTLFLLHWYLAKKEGYQIDFLLDDKGKSNFTYETRSSSREFCDALVDCDLNNEKLRPSGDGKRNSLSKTIRDQPWYFGTWDDDATISGMLTMLDAIHKKFQDSSGFIDLLVDREDPVITFMFLNLEHFNLTDDLYIKMNARGKPLTPFENYKAKFEQFLAESEKLNGKSQEITFGSKTKKVSVHDYFAYKIDTDWSDLFWYYRDEKNLIDNQMMNFFRANITNHFAVNKVGPDNIDELRTLLNLSKNNSQKRILSFFYLQKIKAIDEDLANDIIAILDLLMDRNGIKTYSEEDFYYDEENIFQKVIGNDLEYRDRIRFYAYYQYLTTHGSEGIEQWMRVVYNLTQNVIYNRPEEFFRAIRSIKNLIPYSTDILGYLHSEDNPISGFPEIQTEEERIKAHLIKRSDQWKNAIYDIERHGYFTGQIGFILSFTGIEEYFKDHHNCNWSEKQDDIFFEDFNRYAKKAKAIFTDDGLKGFPNYAWERSLLTKGDYLLDRGSNSSFLIDDHRDISWKRLLREENNGKRKLVKKIFDDSNFNINKIEESLSDIINEAKITDWRKHFVEQPNILDYLGTYKFIRRDNENPNQIYLLKKQRLSADYVEYYTYVLYLNYLSQKEFHPFQNTHYRSVSGTEEEPCAILDKWRNDGMEYLMKIIYMPANKCFELIFSSKNNAQIQDDINHVCSKEMNPSDKHNGNLFFTKKEDDELKPFLNSFCQKLNNVDT